MSEEKLNKTSYIIPDMFPQTQSYIYIYIYLYISRLKVEKKFCKKEKPIPVFFLRKAIVLNRIYTEIVV